MHVKHTVFEKTKMAGSTLSGQEFSARLTQIIEANLQNGKSGISEPAREIGMSLRYSSNKHAIPYRIIPDLANL
jgi:hypothetical protein